MGNVLYLIVVVLIIAWLVGLVGFNAGGLIHLLLVIAVVVILLRVISGKKIL
ncbi:lmo0937 family membrane protein [Lacinutrix sp. Hel_I_90]|uniref:lmo0937 family membrane protein n=1 Tax=Lacinutrix sp. Hel_I_90 TaxID=1249999 RepID=UPI000AC1E766|nr:lmo0937 family membrane protein [Lacinutrix sp. Hel_I_90]